VSPDLVLSTADEAVHLIPARGGEAVYIVYIELDGGSLAVEEQIYTLPVSVGPSIEVDT